MAGRSQQTRLGQSERENGIATQRLAGLSAVHQDSLHAEERSEGESLGLLIRIHQRREDVLRLLLYARGQHILQAVYHLHGHRLRAVVAQGGAAHPSPLPRRHPLVAESQPEVKVLLHEEQTVADHRLGDRTLRAIHAHIAVRERLPRETALRVVRQSNNRLRARMVGVLGYLVVGVVREQRLLGIAPAAGEPARGGDIHP